MLFDHQFDLDTTERTIRMKRMTRKTRVFIGALFVSALFIGVFVLTSFAAPPRAKAAGIGVSYYTDRFTLDPGQADAWISVTCQPGEVLLGGGWASGYKHMYVWRSMPLGSNGWMIGATNMGSARKSVDVWVSCANGNVGSASTRSVSNDFTAPSHNRECVTVTCSGAGTNRNVASGGGFSSNSSSPSDLVVTATHPTWAGTNQWETCVYNPTSTSKTFTAYAVCTNVPGDYDIENGPGVTFESGEVGSDDALCYSYEGKAISGGFDAWIAWGPDPIGDYPKLRIFYNMDKSSWYNWRAKAFIGSSAAADISLVSYSRCYKP